MVSGRTDRYPFRSRFLDLDGFSYHYLDEGRGAAEVGGHAVVMLHGNPTWSFHYRDLVQALRDQHRVVVPDHIGCGYSDKPGDRSYSYRLERRVEDLAALLEHLGVERVSLVVHDWGGMIGLAWAVEQPERLERLVLLNTAAFGLPAGVRLPWQLGLARLPGVGALLVRGTSLFVRGALRSCVRRRLAPEVAAGYLAPYRGWRERIALLRFVEDIPLRPGHPSWDRLRSTEAGLERLRSVPTLICWGMRDFVFDRRFLEQWTRRLPQAEVHRFAGAGHWVLEDAGGEIAALAREFLGDLAVGRAQAERASR